MAVDESGEDVMSNEICRRYNGKQERRRRGGRRCAAPRLGMNKIKRQHVVALAWVAKMKSLSLGESPNVVQKMSCLFLLSSLVFKGRISTWY